MSDLIEKVHGAVSNYCTHSGPPIQGRPCGMCDAITRAAIAAVAEWIKPTTERPCDCTTCYCGNTGDAENTSSWDTQQWLYADLLKQLEQPK